MIFEKGKNSVNNIQRLVRKSNDYGTFERYDCAMVVITSYQSIDIDRYSSIASIVVNANMMYEINYAHGTAKKELESFIKSEIRDSKISEVLK